MKSSLIIPACNEEEALPLVIEEYMGNGRIPTPNIPASGAESAENVLNYIPRFK